MFEQSLDLKNDSKENVLAWLEPWAEDYELSPNDHLKIEITSSVTGVPEIAYRNGGVAVYVWSLCRCRVFMNGHEVTRSSWDVPSP